MPTFSEKAVGAPAPGFAVGVFAAGLPLLSVILTALFLNWGRS